eukprot:CAMPEP_0174585780 /NCGR_PEP_ID=MMETSP0929-20130131/23222_1 /TAXON_ID=548131 ORGANISM="Ostreococcus mediterraneus, Strain clade-D-RCC2572" /NCGR_SAMPLE_ID=MMETSP0929 /ASSEMBLY_ACC=CAM_ASM_000573 /LENGTH=356 /DNA_ID=CAMNT_0015767761 /DNA_START=151 /DNA_END=1222 /DNA_ORIENTATION=+
MAHARASGVTRVRARGVRATTLGDDDDGFRAAAQQQLNLTSSVDSSREHCIYHIGDVVFDELDRTWRYPSNCVAHLHKFDATLAREALSGKSLFFLGNSVNRRLLYAIAHILGGSNATYNRSPVAAEIVQDIFSHTIFEIGVNASGHCSRQYRCSTAAFGINPKVRSISESSLKMFNCQNKSAWVETRKLFDSAIALGFLFTSTPVLPVAVRFLEIWANLDDVSFAASPVDNYDILVVQILILDAKEESYFEKLYQTLKKLMRRRKALSRPVRFILWGSPHNLESELHTTTIIEIIQQKLRPRMRDIGVTVLDVTFATAHASALTLGQHQKGSLHHFMDFTRLMLADMLINTINTL